MTKENWTYNIAQMIAYRNHLEDRLTDNSKGFLVDLGKLFYRKGVRYMEMEEITHEDLDDMGACEDGLEFFNEHFPEGAKVPIPRDVVHRLLTSSHCAPFFEFAQDWRLIELNFDGMDFSGAELCDGNFKGASFRNANFSGCDLSWTLFDKCDLTGARFDGADLSGVDFVECKVDREAVNMAYVSTREYEESVGALEAAVKAREEK